MRRGRAVTTDSDDEREETERMARLQSAAVDGSTILGEKLHLPASFFLPDQLNLVWWESSSFKRRCHDVQLTMQ